MFRFLLFLVCVFPFFVQDAGAQDSLLPPVQQDVQYYTVSAATEGRVAVQKNDGAPRFFPSHAHVQITLGPYEDAVIILPDDVLNLASLRVHHGRHVRLIGGHLVATQEADETIRGLIWFGGTRGSVFVEGVILDANRKNGMDALLVGGYRDQPVESYPDIYVQNVIMKNVYNADGHIYHADCFQFYGPTGVTRMYRVHCETDTQGFFLAPQHPVGGIYLRKVSIVYTNPDNANGYALYLKDTQDDLQVPMLFDDVYVDRRETSFGYGHDGVWEVYSIFPHALQPHGVRIKDGRAYFPYYQEIEGDILQWGGQNFVQGAGAGYQGIDE